MDLNEKEVQLEIKIVPKMSRSGSEEEMLSSDEGVGELGDFIVSDEEQSHEAPQDKDAEVQNDRLLQMTSTLKPNESQTQKLLRAHISVLVSALGGPDHTSPISPPPYKLGQDALACLKDIKRWIKSVDEKKNNFDVALACADSGLVVNDLLVILCQWDSQLNSKKPMKNARTMEKIMLSCLELLVLLTWPTYLISELSENQKLNFASVRKSQIVYKKHILAYNKGQTLKAVIRLVLPTIAKHRLDRDPRDNAILRLVLFFIRNVLNIEPANTSISTKSRKHVTNLDNLPSNVNYDDISMNAVLSCFKKNKVLMFLLTLSGSLGTDFDRETFGQPCLECIYLIFKGIKTQDILNPQQSSKQQQRYQQQQQEQSQQEQTPIQSVTTASGLQLQDLLSEESKRKKFQTQNISTRHGRFGSLLSIQGNNTSYVISGQEALLDTDLSLAKLDKSKKWNNRSHFKYDSDDYVKATAEFLNGSSVLILKEFIEQFLTGGCFNTLIECIGWLLSGTHDLNYVDDYEKACYFLTVAWFLNYKRERNKLLNSQESINIHEDEDGLDYGSVSAGLSEVNFILIISYFRESFEAKNWNSLHVAMLCFRELLLISYSIFSKFSNRELQSQTETDEQEEVDKELAEGIIRKLFSFNDFLNIVIQIPQTASKHSPEYLSVCISVVHIILKSFESFANENIKLYIQTKRKRTKQNKKSINNLDKATEESLRDIIEGSDDELENERVKEVSRERRLDFKATEVRFFQTSIVSTYVEYLSRYEELTHEEIKRCLSYFHRLFVIRKDFTGLYRIDFMHILQRLRNHLPRGSSTRDHVDEFIYYFMKKFKSAFERFPNPIEILFPRFEDMEYKIYLATGDLYLKPEKNNKRSSVKIAKDIEFIRDNFTLDEKFKILVTALYLQEKESLVTWVIQELSKITTNRLMDLSSEQAESNSNEIVQLYPLEEHRRLLINNPYIRLLLTLIGFEVPFIVEEPCELPNSVKTLKLVECLDAMRMWSSKQPLTFDDGKDAMFFLRTKEGYDYERDDDYDGDHYDENDHSIAFETGANPDSDRRNLNELDELDKLEAALEGKSNAATDLPRGVARIKNKRTKKDLRKRLSEKAKSHKKHSSRRPPRSFKVVSDNEEEKEEKTKSAEFVHGSDDESDYEKENEFFNREERLRRLLEESGGIVNPKQLAEFKLAWAKLESSNGSNTAISVSKAIEDTSFVEPAPQTQDIQDTPALGATIESNSDIDSSSASEPELDGSDEEGVSFIENDKTSVSSFTPDFHNETNLKKRNSILQDSDNESEMVDSAIRVGNPRKKRVVISDDEE